MPSNAQHHFISRLVVFCFLSLAMTLSAAQTTAFVTEPSPPFNYLEDGEVAGPAFEIISSICKKMEITCAFELTKWDRAIHMAESGDVNGIFSVGKNAERLEWMYFSTPILETAYGVYVSNDNPMVYERGSDLSGYKVITYGPSNTSSSLEALSRSVPTMDMVVESKMILVLKKFNIGRYGNKAALYLNKDVVEYLIRELELENMRYAGDDKELRYYVGFPKNSNSKEFVDEFNRVLEVFKQDGTLETILTQFSMTPPQ